MFITPHPTAVQVTSPSACSKYDPQNPFDMRVRTLEIRWHDSKPISTCDFQPVPFKKARPTQDKNFVAQSYRLATGGEDNHVRVRVVTILTLCILRSNNSFSQLWLVHPNIMPPSVLENAGTETTTPRPPRVEYLATLSRHSAAVNIVHFSLNGTCTTRPASRVIR